MVVILTLTPVAVTSMAIVRERKHGSLEPLIVTPLVPWQGRTGQKAGVPLR